MNGVIYCRVSSREQTEGTSLEFQEQACREYAAKHHITVQKVFVEQGESAKFADRTQLLELLDFCRAQKGAVQVLIVWKVDRFARNVSDHFSVKATLLKYGVRVASVTEPIDQNPEGKLMETILAGFAQFDNDIRALRTVHGMHRKLEDGIFPWRAPLGYKSADPNGGKKVQPDVPDEPTFGLLQRVWKEFATGAYTKAQMRRLMSAWGVTTQKGVPLSSQSFDQLLENPYYAGILVDPWSGIEFEGKHLAMVTRAEFDRVQAILHRRHRPKPRVRERDEFPLRGAVRCPVCQRCMTGAFSQGRSRRYPYYACANRACGTRKSYPADDIHQEFESLLDRLAPRPEAFDRLEKCIADEIDTRLSARSATAERREAQLKRLKRQMQELINMRVEHLISSEEFIEQKAALQDQIAAVKGDGAHPELYEDAKQNIKEIKAPLSALRETWRAVPLPLRRRFEQLVLPVGFAAGRIRTAEIGCLFKLIGDSSGPNTNVVPLNSASSNQLYEEIQAFADLLRSMKHLHEESSGAVRTSAEKVPPIMKFEPEAGTEKSSGAQDFADLDVSD